MASATSAAKDCRSAGSVAAEGLDLELVGDESAAHHARRAHGHRQQRADLHLALVVGQAPEQALEVGRVEALAALDHEGEGIAARGRARCRAGARAGRPPRAGRPARARGRSRSRARRGRPAAARAAPTRPPSQRSSSAARSAWRDRRPSSETWRSPVPGGGRAGTRRGRSCELVDAVVQAGQLGQGGAEPPLLAAQRLVEGEHEGGVAQGGGHRRPPGRGSRPRPRRRRRAAPARAATPNADGRRLRDRHRARPAGSAAARPASPAGPGSGPGRRGRARGRRRTRAARPCPRPRRLARRAAAATPRPSSSVTTSRRRGEAPGASGRSSATAVMIAADGQDDLPRPPADPQVEDRTAAGEACVNGVGMIAPVEPARGAGTGALRSLAAAEDEGVGQRGPPR